MNQRLQTIENLQREFQCATDKLIAAKKRIRKITNIAALSNEQQERWLTEMERTFTQVIISIEEETHWYNRWADISTEILNAIGEL